MKRVFEHEMSDLKVISAGVRFFGRRRANLIGFPGLVSGDEDCAVSVGYNVQGIPVEARVLEHVNKDEYDIKNNGAYRRTVQIDAEEIFGLKL